MRNLVHIITQYFSFFFFLLLEAICLFLFFKNNNYQQNSVINSSRTVAGFLFSKKSNFVNYFHLEKINDSLMAENAKLKMKLGINLKKNHLHDSSFIQEKKLDSLTEIVHYNMMAVKVLNNTIDQKINYITLNKGIADGIEKNMAVLSDKGIVGKITTVNPQYSIATAVISDKFNVSAMTPKGTVGKIIWDANHSELVTLTGIPQSEKLKMFDTIVTSGFSSIFPENIMIGRVVKVESPSSYKVWLSTNFSKLHFVYIIKETAQQRVLDSIPYIKE